MREAAPSNSPTALTGGRRSNHQRRSMEAWLRDLRARESPQRLAASPKRSGVHRSARRTSPQR
eukprot:5682991-Prymnesium_polylepis.1